MTTDTNKIQSFWDTYRGDSLVRFVCNLFLLPCVCLGACCVVAGGLLCGLATGIRMLNRFKPQIALVLAFVAGWMIWEMI